MLEARDIYKQFAPDKPVLDGVSFVAQDGEIACLLGPSGCGKTTLLRIVAGLETADSGSVWFDGVDVTNTPVHLRRFGLMFQDYALFPHMTAGANVAFGLRMAGWTQAQTRARVDEMLELINLPGYAGRAVDELSGGEQQRVALARTLAPSPRLLMLDEPFANLDRLLREELVDELRLILKRIAVTTLFVTHDQAEAFALSDRVVVMRAGHVEQDGLPQAVYRQPANTFVAGFLGFRNMLPGQIESTQPWVLRTPLGRMQLASPPDASVLAGSFCVLIRPDAADFADGATPAGAIRVAGRVLAASFRGNIYRLQVAPAADPTFRLSFDLETRGRNQLPHAGDEVELAVREQDILLVRDS